jgi:hypothetical protein
MDISIWGYHKELSERVCVGTVPTPSNANRSRVAARQLSNRISRRTGFQRSTIHTGSMELAVQLTGLVQHEPTDEKYKNINKKDSKDNVGKKW